MNISIRIILTVAFTALFLYQFFRLRRFYLLVDGSYLYIEDGREEVFGEAHLLADGKLSQISKLGESVLL